MPAEGHHICQRTPESYLDRRNRPLTAVTGVQLPLGDANHINMITVTSQVDPPMYGKSTANIVWIMGL
jgi:hypothetical protein